MLHRVARSRVLLFLLVVLTAFVSFCYYEEQQAGAAGKNVAVVRVAAAHATAVGAQAVEQLRSVLAAEAKQNCMRDTANDGSHCPDRKLGRLVMLAKTSVKHTRTIERLLQGTTTRTVHERYTPDKNSKRALPGLVAAGAGQVAQYLAQHHEQGRR